MSFFLTPAEPPMTRENSDKPSMPDTIEDLTSDQILIGDAQQVKGGFNPQPDPPRIAHDISHQIAAKFVKQ